MNTTSKRIVKRFAATLSALAVCGVAVYFSYRHMEENSLPAIGSAQSDKPVIVLDAGHGESD